MRPAATAAARTELRSPASLAATAALGSLLAACSTTYQPRPSERVGVVIHHGAAAYVKNGHELPIGPFGTQLQAMVTDVPAAAAHARTARTQFMVGVPAYLTGLGGVVLGIVLLSGPVGWVVIGIGGATAGTGLGLMGAGLTHTIDAVNIHNDQTGPPDASR